VEARRFRPGLDYTLATGCDYEARLDVVLDLTPVPPQDQGEDSRCGGWECYMAADEGGDDPAVYRSGSSKQKSDNEGPGEGDEDDGATLLTRLPIFNQLQIVLRDEGVLRFVKYVSAESRRSRWDIVGEYEIDMVSLEDASGTDGSQVDADGDVEGDVEVGDEAEAGDEANVEV